MEAARAERDRHGCGDDRLLQLLNEDSTSAEALWNQSIDPELGLFRRVAVKIGAQSLHLSMSAELIQYRTGRIGNITHAVEVDSTGGAFTSTIDGKKYATIREPITEIEAQAKFLGIFDIYLRSMGLLLEPDAPLEMRFNQMRLDGNDSDKK